ncbi:N-alpha-acetyltransferase 35, NatC auxiliary subunit [Monosporozyma unispora]
MAPIDNESLHKSLDNLSLNNESTFNNVKLVDITTQLDHFCSKLEPKAIVKEPLFDLFQGTHSLEINNPKLDSYLIPLTKEEIEFDCDVKHGATPEEDLKYVASISDRLLRYVVSWLNEYQSLPTTLLSCRYMERLLNIKPSQQQVYISYETGDPLYDKALASLVIGVSYFATFIKGLLFKRVIYEEEDLNFNFMGIQGFDKLPEQEDVLHALTESIEYIFKLYGNNLNDYSTHLINILKAVRCLVKIENVITKYSNETDYLDKLIQIATYLDGNELKFDVPMGSFSMSIQKSFSNQFPPKQVVTPGKNYLGLTTMAQDIKLILRVAEIDTAVEALQFASFFNKLKQRHVLARALFPLFLVRENGEVIGKFSLEDFVFSHCMEFSLMSAKIVNEINASDELNNLLSPRLQECANVLYEFYQNTSQNTARYRQGYNRQLLLWDSAQAQLETVEMTLISNKVHDVVKNNDGSEIPLMPYASWVFTMKVIAMIEFVLKGFDLEVYKPFETFDMYYYTYHLSHQLQACLDKVHQFIVKKIDSIHSMNKKIKKLKAGEKKEKLKLTYTTIMEEETPQLQTNKQYLNYLLLQCNMNKSLSLFQVLQFAILKSVKLIDNKAPLSSKFVKPELIHNLRFKTFSSIGVPELPDYKSFQETLEGFVIHEDVNSPSFVAQLERIKTYMIVQINEATKCIKTIIRAIEANDKNGEVFTGTRLIKDDALHYYNKYLGSTLTLQANLEKLIERIKNKSIKNDESTVILEFQPDSSTYFPTLTVVDQQK